MNKENKKIRLLMSKIGQDAHDRGVKVVTTMLRQAGIEVIYTGIWQTPESVVQAAIQEDVDIIAISTLTYDHPLIFKILDLLKEKHADIPVVAGGIIPSDEAEDLKKAGLKEVFNPGCSIETMLECIHRVTNK